MPNQPKIEPQHESISYAGAPYQWNAPWGFFMGAVIGLAIGIPFGDLIYDALAMLLPGSTEYQSLPVLATLPLLGKAAFLLLDQQFHSVPAWVFYPITAGLAAAIAGGITGVKLTWITGERHIAGPRFVSQENIPGPLHKRDALGIKIGPIQLTREEESQAILTIGKSGGGKTTLLRPIAEQAINRGDAVLIIDFKGDYLKSFGSQAAYIAPWSKKSRRWQLGADIRDEAEAEAFAAGIIAETEEPIWGQSARGLLEGIVMHLQTTQGTAWGWLDIAEKLKTFLADVKLLAETILPYRPLIAARITRMGDDTRESILFNLTTLQTILSISDLEAKLPAKYWSVTDWLNGTQPVVILGWSEERELLSQRIALPIFKIAMQRLLSQDDRRPEEPGYWFIIDECGQLGEIPAFISAFTAVRSRGGRMVIGFQSFAQITDYYGERARTITGCETRIIGRLLNPEDAQDASDICGDRVVERLNVSTTREGGRTESWPRTEEPVYRKERFYKLGRQATGVRFAYVGRGVVSEVTFPFLPKPAVFAEDE